MRHRGTRQRDENVTLNVTAMLDMAFQLLAFFVLTFRRPTQEGQIALRMPGSPGGIVCGIPPDDLRDLDRLLITIDAQADGDIRSVAIGDHVLPSRPTAQEQFAQLNAKLREAFHHTRYNEVVLQVGSSLRYERLMQTVGLCSEQSLSSGEKLNKLTFVELPSSLTPNP